MNHDQLCTIEDVLALMRRQDYICDRKMATALFLALKIEKPFYNLQTLKEFGQLLEHSFY
ncbi:MAG: hypothetical protein HQK59_06230 [Deltaproteobacteria bacterium]|nr:hypothetical protein [Deltaproteobacteria bacterium]